MRDLREKTIVWLGVTKAARHQTGQIPQIERIYAPIIRNKPLKDAVKAYPASKSMKTSKSLVIENIRPPSCIWFGAPPPGVGYETTQRPMWRNLVLLFRLNNGDSYDDHTACANPSASFEIKLIQTNRYSKSLVKGFSLSLNVILYRPQQWIHSYFRL